MRSCNCPTTRVVSLSATQERRAEEFGGWIQTAGRHHGGGRRASAGAAGNTSCGASACSTCSDWSGSAKPKGVPSQPRVAAPHAHRREAD